MAAGSKCLSEGNLALSSDTCSCQEGKRLTERRQKTCLTLHRWLFARNREWVMRSLTWRIGLQKVRCTGEWSGWLSVKCSSAQEKQQLKMRLDCRKGSTDDRAGVRSLKNEWWAARFDSWAMCDSERTDGWACDEPYLWSIRMTATTWRFLWLLAISLGERGELILDPANSTSCCFFSGVLIASPTTFKLISRSKSIQQFHKTWWDHSCRATSGCRIILSTVRQPLHILILSYLCLPVSPSLVSHWHQRFTWSYL